MVCAGVADGGEGAHDGDAEGGADLADGVEEPCGCRKPCPRRSCSVFVFVNGAAEAVASADVEACDLV